MPDFQTSEAVEQLATFAGAFLCTGAVGFRFAALRGRAHEDGPDRQVYADVEQRAALLGLLGAVISGGLVLHDLGAAIGGEGFAWSGQVIATIAFAVATIAGFVVASGRVRLGWWLAAASVVGGALKGVVALQWKRMVNPVHMLAAGLWIGSLFFLVVAGLAIALRDGPSRERRGAIVADLVNRFSPLALVCGTIVALSGLLTAWNHLNPLTSLFTTTYGQTLIVKLCLVAGVFGLGAWNWRRQRPRLGSDAGALAVRRSARGELLVAGVVLIVTAVLVSLPSPHPPRPPAPAPTTAPAT